MQGPAGSGELLLQAREIRMLLCAQAAQGGTLPPALESLLTPTAADPGSFCLVSDAIREMSSPSTASTHCVVSLWL